jgi:osmotically-inducible protein OsmY
MTRDGARTMTTTAPTLPNAELIDDDIVHALGHSWFFDPHTIDVAIQAGKVVLTGHVRSARERRMAAAAAWAHEGVSEVRNELVVNPR